MVLGPNPPSPQLLPPRALLPQDCTTPPGVYPPGNQWRSRGHEIFSRFFTTFDPQANHFLIKFSPLPRQIYRFLTYFRESFLFKNV